MEVFDIEILKGIGSPSKEGLMQALKLAVGCREPGTSVRPTMDEAVKQLKGSKPRSRSVLYSLTGEKRDWNPSLGERAFFSNP